MTDSEESYVLDTLKELQEVIRSPDFRQLIKETHENNIMLRQIIRYLNAEIANADNENMNDFGRNILANLISNGIDFSKFIRK
jgi:hypothetical protein